MLHIQCGEGSSAELNRFESSLLLGYGDLVDWPIIEEWFTTRMFLKIKWRKKSSNEEYRFHIVLVQNKFLRKMLFRKILWSCSSLTLNSPQPAFLSLLPIFFRRVSLAEYPSTQGLLTLLQEIKSRRCVWPRAAWRFFQKSSMREKSEVYPWAGCIYYYYYQCCIRLPCCYYFTWVCNNCT